jgi:phosphoribosyl-dephospho-CoA transferase
MRRHDFVYVCPVAWRSLVESRDDLAVEPVAFRWADCGWPLISRRALPGELGLALGLPLPPSAGKRRLSVMMQATDIIAIASPPSLSSARDAAPRCWRPAMDRLCALADDRAIEVRVFGSLAWQSLTRLDYITETSDLDLLLHLDCGSDVASITSSLAEIESTAPMRIDGEVVRRDGTAANWRELHAGAREVLVKTVSGVALLERSRFLAGPVAA